jgi:hypothetical protein
MIGTSPTSYLYQIHSIHRKGGWHTLYVLGSHMSVSFHDLAKFGKFGVDVWQDGDGTNSRL